MSTRADLEAKALAQKQHHQDQQRYGSARQLAGAEYRVSPGVTATVVWATADAYCLAAVNEKGAADPSVVGASLGKPFPAWFWSSVDGLRSEADDCRTAPSGASGIDGYWDSTGAH